MESEAQHPVRKRALVLSAGGMFGAYQAGVWDSLYGFYKPDLVVGASVGSLNGYVIACGAPPDELISRWRSLEAIERLQWRISPHLTRGILDNSLLENWIQELFELGRPECDYALVATETLRLSPRCFCWPEITWKHLAASCGVPVFLPTYRIDGTLYSDGGLVDPLPIKAALDLGATEIVSVDLMSRRPLPVRTMVTCLQKYSGYRRPHPENVPWIQINPSEPLGGPRDSMYWTRKNTERWLAMGRRDALAVRDALASGAGSATHERGVKCLERWETDRSSRAEV